MRLCREGPTSDQGSPDFAVHVAGHQAEAVNAQRPSDEQEADSANHRIDDKRVKVTQHKIPLHDRHFGWLLPKLWAAAINEATW